MNADPNDRDKILAQASRAIRTAMEFQRRELAVRLRSDPLREAPFPRSVAMRVLMRHPVQSSAWLYAIVRSRIGRALLVMLSLGLLLRMIRADSGRPRRGGSDPTPPPGEAPCL